MKTKAVITKATPIYIRPVGSFSNMKIRQFFQNGKIEIVEEILTLLTAEQVVMLRITMDQLVHFLAFYVTQDARRMPVEMYAKLEDGSVLRICILNGFENIVVQSLTVGLANRRGDGGDFGSKLAEHIKLNPEDLAILRGRPGKEPALDPAPSFSFTNPGKCRPFLPRKIMPKRARRP